MKMSICPNCGNEVDGWMVCERCGAKMDGGRPANPQQTSADFENRGAAPRNDGNQAYQNNNTAGKNYANGKNYAHGKNYANGKNYAHGKNYSGGSNNSPANNNTRTIENYDQTVSVYGNYGSADHNAAQPQDPGFIDMNPNAQFGMQGEVPPNVQGNMPPYMYGAAPPNTQGNMQMNSGFGQPPKKSKAPVIVAVCIAATLVIAAVIVVLILLNNKSSDSDSAAAEESSIAESGQSAPDDAEAQKRINELMSGDINGRDSSSSSSKQISDAKKDKVEIPEVKNTSASAAKSKLESLGVKVEVKYEFSDSVKKDYVISQSVTEGSELKKGESVTLVVSKGSDKCPYDYEQKLTVTASGGSSYGQAVLYEWKDGDWSKVASYSATVGKNGIGNTKEGSSTSPEGIHKLGVVLCSSHLNTDLNQYKVTGNTVVVDDTNSGLYNQIKEKSQVPSGTHTDNIGKGLTNGTTYATIYIEHNGSGLSSSNVRSGGGSAIGLRGQYDSLEPTYGDVDISASDMKDLLSRLKSGKNPVIELKTE